MTQSHSDQAERMGVLQSGILRAEYSLRRSRPDGHWVAVGHVRDMSRQDSHEGWIISGYGDTSKEAVNRLQALLDSESARLDSRGTSQ